MTIKKDGKVTSCRIIVTATAIVERDHKGTVLRERVQDGDGLR